MARDASGASDDRIEILLDTFGDQRSAFYFATNPAGAMEDGLAFANGQLNTEWDVIWNVRTRRTRVQHLPYHLSKVGGRSLVRRPSPDTVSAGLGSRSDHES